MQKRTKKLVMLLAVVMLMTVCFAFVASAEERTIIESGNCGANGDNVTYVLYDDGELVISGEGEIEKEFFWSKDDVIKLTIIEGVTSIGNDAFGYCENLKTVVIPDSVTNMGKDPFFNCHSLSNVTLSKNATTLNRIFYNCISLKSISIPDGVVSLDGTFHDCHNLSSVTLPETLTTIGDNSFINCYNLESIIIPNSVTKIGEYAFGGCTKLSSINIPDSTTSIDFGAFMMCNNLKNLSIPKNVHSISTSIVYSCLNLEILTFLNPNCILEESFGYSFPSQTILSSYVDSTAETYAKERNYHFLPLDGEDAGTIQNHQFPACWSTILEPTCSAEGLKIKTCRTCGISESESIPCTEHGFSEWSTEIEADCTRKGIETRECSTCEKLEIKAIEALGHSFSTTYTVDIEPTCITNGSKSRHCTVCDAKTDITVIEATNEHRYIDVTVTPNGDVESYTVHICAVCDYRYMDNPETPDEPEIPDEPEVPDTPNEPEENEPCSCDCHAGGIKAFFFKIINFFEKLFGQNKVCECGVKH